MSSSWMLMTNCFLAALNRFTVSITWDNSMSFCAWTIVVKHEIDFIIDRSPPSTSYSRSCATFLNLRMLVPLSEERKFQNFRMKTIIFQLDLPGMFGESDTKREVHKYCCSPLLPSNNSVAAVINAKYLHTKSITNLVIIVPMSYLLLSLNSQCHYPKGTRPCLFSRNWK